MKQLFTIAILALALTPTSAQMFAMEKTVVCGSTELVLTVLRKEFEELPQWMGRENTSGITVMTNKKTGTWSIVQFTRQVACILASGTAGETVDIPPQQKKKD